MSEQLLEKPGIERLRAGRARRAGAAATGSLVATECPPCGATLPLIVRPALKGVDILEWARANREWVESRLHAHGALLFRDFEGHSVARFEEFGRAVCGELLEYRERSSPRHSVRGNVYTSTDYPAEHDIFLHNENSYQYRWPMKLLFYCAEAAPAGGETPIADCRKVFARIDPRVAARFRELGWMYVRNFGDGFGLPWQTVFRTGDRAAVEEHCRAVGIRVEWKEGDRLRTRAVRPAVSRHPRTGETVWFNHATFFHVSTLEEGVRRALLSDFPAEDLPTNTFYGDGSPIEDAVLEHLREAYRSETVALPWRVGDIMLVDNMLAAHGRRPYAGPRRTLVAMGEPMSWAEI
jgi:alpha-ketoglutarate-dependent taurine dioxygenase